ncbi:MAG: hypothetical protein JRF65_09355, partial [Deltaproteobacteria bacterium]|nr:hypothetical protein [Deltaproteobacteria bacterium]
MHIKAFLTQQTKETQEKENIMAEETGVIVARMKAKEGMEETMAAELSTL